MDDSTPAARSEKRPVLSVIILGILLATLGSVMFMYPGGAIGFMQALVEEMNAMAVAVLAAFIGLVFVILYKIGLTFAYEEEIGGQAA